MRYQTKIEADGELSNDKSAGDAVTSPGLMRAQRCYYCYYMPRNELKVARIGNSRGVRLPADTLKRYRIGTSVIMEERLDGILLRPHGAAPAKLSWADTAREMAEAAEDWSEWDAAASDGLEGAPWDDAPKAAKKRKRK